MSHANVALDLSWSSTDSANDFLAIRVQGAEQGAWHVLAPCALPCDAVADGTRPEHPGRARPREPSLNSTA